jgi:prepilin-type N-terminal cleavage/methylation domain-containing protein
MNMKKESGFTLIELLISTAILAVVVAGLSFTINTIMNTYNIARDQSVALRQVQNAGYWMTQDIQRVESPPPNLSAFPIQMQCYTGDDLSDTETIAYSIVSENDINRIYKSVNGGENMLIANYIIDTPDKTSISSTTDNVTGEKYYVLEVTASYNETEESGVYVIKPRVQ